MRKKIAMYHLLEVILLFATLLLLGMMLCMLVYRKYLPLEIYNQWHIYFVVAVACYAIKIIIREIRRIEEEEAHRRFIHFLKKIKEEQEGEEDGESKL